MLHPKLFNLLITWFISTVLIVAVTPSKSATQEIENLSAIADNSAEVLLAQSLQEELDAFFDSGKYTYCDAKILGNYWGRSEVDAKVLIGQKILSGERGIAYLEQYHVDAQIQALSQPEPSVCFFYEKGYTYDDAVALAEFWFEASPWEAKIRAEKNFILGKDEVVKNALRLAKRE
jgi:hypothetical protein